MYTQCPDCSVAFRVTAEVLKKAAGKVRCGGCGNAFNALAHLSEEKPGSAPARETPDAPVPQLTPELPEDDATATRPKTISAEQSAALLKTLDELAGEDIRIEDTGVEWRVLSDDEEYDEEDQDAPAVIDTREESVIEQLEAIAAGTTADEMRFDDNTPLPDDFGLDDEPAYEAPPTVEKVAEPEADPADAQVDLAFGEPDEWEDLLGEAASDETGEAEAVEKDAVVADLADAEPEQDTAPDDIPLDMDTQFQLQAEAMGVDLSGIHEKGTAAAEPDDLEVETEADAIDPADTSIDEDLIAAAFEAEAEARKEVSAAEEMLEELAEDDAVDAAEDSIDIEAQLAELEAYAPEATNVLETGSADDAIELEAADNEDADQLEAAEPEELEFEAMSDSDSDDEPGVDVLEFEEPEESEDEVELIEDLHVEQELAIEAELRAAEVVLEDDIAADEPVTAAEPEPESGEHEVPEMSEEEMTINMMIDQDLLAIAVEDDDGFTSTIVQKQVSSEDDIPRERKAKKAKKEVAADEPGTEEIDDAKADVLAAAAAGGLVETIIMEGESIRGEMDEQREAKKASFMEEAKSNIASLKKAESGDKPSVSVGMIVGVVVLVLLLIGQYIHQHRESLATIPAFNSSIGSIYRSIGQPVTPEWNVSGWRFEATKGDIGDGEAVLTIYSRIGNASESALPYPLIHVALTDRFEEIIGSKVLEPAEYLAGDPDPRKTVAPRATFDAAISIATPSPEATGFRLDVCYRLSGGQLRCAIEDFK